MRWERIRPVLKLFSGHVLGIEIGAKRLPRRHTGHEGAMRVQVRPRALVNREDAKACSSERRAVLLQVAIKRLVTAPQLLEEDIVNHAAGLNEFQQGAAI